MGCDYALSTQLGANSGAVAARYADTVAPN
jgi:hypothetical protein